MDQTIKAPWKSKTMILNAVMGLLAFAALFWPGAEGIKVLIESHPEEIAMLWSILNVILRAITKDKIGLGE